MVGAKIFRIASIIATSIVLAFAVSCSGSTPTSNNVSGVSPVPANTGMPKKTYSAYPPMVIDQNKQYTAIIETNKGKLTLELFAKDVPKAVSNFVFLARDGFYDGLKFHRVIPGFVAQGGDPLGNSTGGPGYTFGYEITSHKHVRGALSMAHSTLPDSNGSQFYICLADLPDLDGKYSVFGQLTDGWDVLDKIIQGDVMTKVTIIEK